MTEKSKKHFENHCQEIEKYLSGERTNPLICTTYAIAKKLQKKYNISLTETEVVNGLYGLCMFEIEV